ncbi:MAG: peroxidase-related enzyme [Gammaproteobacteria bacterium]|jgi:uncharacterized peroxidase-related enzyme
MAFVSTIRPDQSTGDVREMYLRQQAKYGYVPNYAKLFCHRPEVMKRWAALLSEIRRHMSPRRFELVTFAAAHTLRNSSCTLAHGTALTEYLSPEDVRAVANDTDVSALTEAEAAMVKFARKVARDAAAITAGDVAVLRKHGFADEEIFDIVATAAARAFFTKVLDGLGAEPDSIYGEMDETFRKSLAVGGPIDFREPERVCVERPVHVAGSA